MWSNSAAINVLCYSNPRVSSLTLKSMMTGRKFVSVSTFHKKHRTSALDGDWATIGVIISKTEVRKSCKVHLV